MALITFEHVAAHLDGLTEAQLDKCHRTIDEATGQVFYQVESSEYEQNEQMYKVTYDEETGFHCTCKSGQWGFANVKHWSGVDWHVRASVKRELEFRAEAQTRQDADAREQEARREEAAKKEQERQQEQAAPADEPTREQALERFRDAHRIDGRRPTREEAERLLFKVSPRPTREEAERDMQRYQARPFRIM
ncbi:hypothetical protein Krac_0093 [Ktedonobacter racemifer DSM 44963]|uniref:Uncharacterized protein n=2 Tax=Ktedonobacter racemifer TaxID=363277 RepID=D6U8Q5_KTERA|nr:hypothetical protein Krac_0093 [Ktedonobacter racemifer DSM 44963]